MRNKAFFALAGLMMAVAIPGLVSCNSGTKSSADNATDSQAETSQEADDFNISLAQWSLHKTFFGGEITDWEEHNRLLKEDPDALLKGPDPMEFPQMAASYGIHTIELVNTFYYSKAGDMAYWEAFKKKCDEAGVDVGLIMCDALGNLGDADPAAREAAVKNHYAWVDIASFLGAASIRVNAAGEGTEEEVAANAADGLSKIAQYGATKGVNIIVENHGGISSDGKWLAGVMDQVGMENVGTLPDFGNFCIEGSPQDCVTEYDRYQGTAELMPYAKGVSAKSWDFDENGNETRMDFLRLMKIVKQSGFTGNVGIEYEGTRLSEPDGIRATKALLEKVFEEL
jgi:sugar phosphate isomerase/epimerase